jgi:hypothetical protein
MKFNSPFPLHTQDYLTDERVIAMNNRERGCYVTLLLYCWKEGSIPDDLHILSKMCGETRVIFTKIWHNLKDSFRPHPNDDKRLINPRVEKERESLELEKNKLEYERKQYLLLVEKENERKKVHAEIGKLGGITRWNKTNSEDNYNTNIIDDSVANGVGNSVANGVANGVANSVANGVGNGVGNGVVNSVGNSVANGVGNSVANGVGNSVANGVGNSVANGVGNSVAIENSNHPDAGANGFSPTPSFPLERDNIINNNNLDNIISLSPTPLSFFETNNDAQKTTIFQHDTTSDPTINQPAFHEKDQENNENKLNFQSNKVQTIIELPTNTGDKSEKNRENLNKNLKKNCEKNLKKEKIFKQSLNENKNENQNNFLKDESKNKSHHTTSANKEKNSKKKTNHTSGNKAKNKKFRSGTPSSQTQEKVDLKKIQDEINSKFNRFWEAYPRKHKAVSARAVFEKINPDKDLFIRILGKLDEAKKCRQWNQDQGRFIPLAENWLSNECWNDQYCELVKVKNNDKTDYNKLKCEYNKYLAENITVTDQEVFDFKKELAKKHPSDFEDKIESKLWHSWFVIKLRYNKAEKSGLMSFDTWKKQFY